MNQSTIDFFGGKNPTLHFYQVKILFHLLIHVFFHSVVTDYIAFCLLESESVSSTCFLFLSRHFKSFQCLLKCAAMPVPWACVPTVKMVQGLGPNGNLVAELERIEIRICCS